MINLLTHWNHLSKKIKQKEKPRIEEEMYRNLDKRMKLDDERAIIMRKEYVL